jgi:hypothetical protein
MLRFYFLLFIILSSSFKLYSQQGLYTGLSVDAGLASHSFGENNKILKTSFPSYQLQGGFIVQYRAFNRIGFELGINQNYQSWKFKDRDFSDRHPGYESIMKNKMSYYSYHGILQFLQPLGGKTSLVLGIGYNFNLIGKKSLTSERAFPIGFETVTINSNYNSKNNSVIGEIGIQQKINKNILTISLKGNFGSGSLMNGTYAVTSGTATLTSDEFHSNGSFVGLNLKYAFCLFEKEKKNKVPREVVEPVIVKKDTVIKPPVIVKKDTTVKPVKPKVLKDSTKIQTPKIVEGRIVKVNKKITVRSDKIKVLIWDHQEVDGDRISLYLNGNWILTDYTLEKKQLELELTLKPGKNVFILHALNLGKFPPNTASMIVKDGKGKDQQLILESTLEESGTIIINYLP